MLVAAAFLPHPPVLVPEVASGAALELAALREACAVALERVLSAQPTLVIVVGDASERSTYSAGTGGSFAGFGVPVATALPGSDGDGVVGGVVRGEARLPLSLAIGAWLMERSGPWPAVRGEGVPATMASPDAASLGEQWAASSERVALIVMGDGATTLTVKAPGYLRDGAKEWQRAVTQSLVDADLAALKAITPEDASILGAAGRAAWQVAAGAADGATDAGGGRWRGDLLADEAPYGVAYLVALWQRTPA